MFTNLIKSITPSFRTSKDLLRVTMKDGGLCSYQIIPINDIKLTPIMRYKLNKTRRSSVIIDPPNYNKNLGVIVAYRNREEHLKQFPQYLTTFLTEQGINHEILIVEQTNDKFFNRGKLFNIGAELICDKCDYFCFHDIDMLPQNASYAYVNHPILLANSVSQFDNNNEQPVEIWDRHSSYFGGVILFSKEDFIKINGFSNNYWHWGYEDDDLFMRCLQCGLTPIAYTDGRYVSLPHEKAVSSSNNNPQFNQYLANKKRYKKMRRGLIDLNRDGLNSVNYAIIGTETNDLYRKILVEI